MQSLKNLPQIQGHKLSTYRSNNYVTLMILQVCVQSGPGLLVLCDSTSTCQENECV